MRHIFVRIEAEFSCGIAETQEALGHRHAYITRVYVDSRPKKKDNHNRYVLKALDLPELEEAEFFHDPSQDEADIEKGFIYDDYRSGLEIELAPRAMPLG